jgi:prevent-host-death family protein
MMKVMPLSEVKAKLSSLIDEVREREEELVITRNGRGVAVLMSMDVFDPAIGQPLRGDLAGFRSARVGRLRIIYASAADAVRVLRVGRRATIYEEAERTVSPRSREHG